MHASRRELLDDFLAFVGEVGDDTARDVAERLLNRVLTAIWLKAPFRAFRSPVPFQLTLAVNQARYSLPDHFGRVGPGKVRNLTRGGAELRALADGETDHYFPRTGTSLEVAQQSVAYEIAGTAGVHTQPASTGDPLEVISDNVADVDVVAAIAGEDASGHWTRNQVTLNGTNAVAIGTWAFADEFAKAYQASATPVTELTSSRGTVTLRKVAGAVELQKLFPQESSRDHPIFIAIPKPVAADVIAIPMIRRPKRLFKDADTVPDLWVPALFEAMQIEWQVNTGELSRAQAQGVARPAFLDLLSFEHEITPRGNRTPFGGG